MLSHVCARPVAPPHSQQKACRHKHTQPIAMTAEVLYKTAGMQPLHIVACRTALYHVARHSSCC
jgi:hypothetical protein